jgi:hypothetical protein
MASEGGKYRTEKELEELAEASFPGNREECDALCEDLKDAEEEYDRLVEAELRKTERMRCLDGFAQSSLDADSCTAAPVFTSSVCQPIGDPIRPRA